MIVKAAICNLLYIPPLNGEDTHFMDTAGT